MHTDQALQISLTRDFAASKQQLYEAWTDGDELKQWWKPMGKLLVKVENDIREGGRVAYHFEDDLVISGVYEQVAEGEKLVYTWNWQVPEEAVHNGDYRLHISFEGNEQQSRLVVLQELFKEEHAIQPHEQGWQQALDALDAHLRGRKA